MPVANIIAIHEEVRNSGFSPSLPSGIRPNRLTATTMTKIVKTVAAMTKSHPKLSITPVRAAPATTPRLSGEMKPQTTKATARNPAVKKTGLSRPIRRRYRFFVGGFCRWVMSSRVRSKPLPAPRPESSALPEVFDGSLMGSVAASGRLRRPCAAILPGLDGEVRGTLPKYVTQATERPGRRSGPRYA